MSAGWPSRFRPSWAEPEQYPDAAKRLFGFRYRGVGHFQSQRNGKIDEAFVWSAPREVYPWPEAAQ